MHGISRASTPGPGASRLTANEDRIVGLIAEGRTNPGVAKALGLSTRTVEWHLSRIYRKLGVRTRRELEAALTAPAPLESERRPK
jgi:LuxR family maltose regulon positive regulatory protein